MNTEHKPSEIRQIGITVSDVGTALSFYRDVLGLMFLISPTPNYESDQTVSRANRLSPHRVFRGKKK